MQTVHHHHGHSHAPGGAPHRHGPVAARPRLSWLRQPLAQRLLIVAALLAPLWLAVLWALS